MILPVKAEAGRVSFGSDEQPKYDQLAQALDGFFGDLMRPLSELRGQVFTLLPVPEIKAERPFRYTEKNRRVVDQAIDEFLAELAGPDRSRRGFVNGGLESDTPDGVIQQREILSYAVGLERGAGLTRQSLTLSAERQAPAVRAMLDSAFSRLSRAGALRLEGTRDELHGILVSATDAGLSPLETARQLQRYFGTTKRNQMEVIARTEGAAAAIEGSRNQMQEYGVRFVKWLLSVNACPVCRRFEGLLIPIEDTARHPPYASHPNCVCDLAPA